MTAGDGVEFRGDGALGAVFDGVDRRVRGLLDMCLDGHELSWQQATELCAVSGRELTALCAAADHLRAQQVGDRVAYVVNRNINFTNVCVKSCKFCAFSRVHRSEEGYFLDQDEVVRRAQQAYEVGATEVCVQAGLPPGVDGRIYVDLCRALKRALPEMHIHAFSPEEIKYGAGLSGVSFRDYIRELKDAGLGSIPGTSAEILEDPVRHRIAGSRITTAEWLEVITTAHELGIPTTSTIMFGHIDDHAQRMRHLDLLRSVQRETRGFTELVPLSFVHQEAPMYFKNMLPGLKAGPTGNEVVRLFAISRLMLGRHIPHLQASWVKEGIRQAQWLLSCGADDLGGTLINESISTAAGAAHGQLMTPRELRRHIRDAGRIPVQRTTTYEPLRVFAREALADEPSEPLDEVRDRESVFGSYDQLIRDGRFRFRRARAAGRSSD